MNVATGFRRTVTQIRFARPLRNDIETATGARTRVVARRAGVPAPRKSDTAERAADGVSKRIRHEVPHEDPQQILFKRPQDVGEFLSFNDRVFVGGRDRLAELIGRIRKRLKLTLHPLLILDRADDLLAKSLVCRLRIAERLAFEAECRLRFSAPDLLCSGELFDLLARLADQRSRKPNVVDLLREIEAQFLQV